MRSHDPLQLLSASEDSTCSVWHINDDYKVAVTMVIVTW